MSTPVRSEASGERAPRRFGARSSRARGWLLWLGCSLGAGCVDMGGLKRGPTRLDGIGVEPMLKCEGLLAMAGESPAGRRPRLLVLDGSPDKWSLSIVSPEGEVSFRQDLDPSWGRPAVALRVAGATEVSILIGFPNAVSRGLRTGLLAALKLSHGSLELVRRGTRIGDRYGIQLARAGDLDGDGLEEILVGADQAGTVGIVRSGYAELLRGADLSPAWRFSATGSVGFGSCLAGLGDLDGDGVPDLLIGGRHEAWTFYSGADGSLLHGAFGFDPGTLGVHVIEDMNADGIDDLIVERLEAVRLVSGADGRDLRDFYPPAEVLNRSSRFPGSVSLNAGDFDGDGQDDWATGDFGHARLRGPGSQPTWEEHCGRVTVYSGLTGRAILIVEGAQRHEQLGIGLQPAGDVDGDGMDDLYIAARKRLYLLRGR